MRQPNPQLLVVIILLGQTKLGPPTSIASQATSLLNMQLSTHNITLQLKFQSVSTTQLACTQLVSNVQWIGELGIKNHREMSECFLYKVTIQNLALVKIMGWFPSKGCIASLFNHPFGAIHFYPSLTPIGLAHFGGQLIVQLVRLSNFYVILNFHVQVSEGICQ